MTTILVMRIHFLSATLKKVVAILVAATFQVAEPTVPINFQYLFVFKYGVI